ncbi:MAG: hypothetical protein LBS29_04325 [Endomicrobium sp.]|jgi:hypothetical protein|nr:hypothetical protein [Endomicrobium sp.]
MRLYNNIYDKSVEYTISTSTDGETVVRFGSPRSYVCEIVVSTSAISVGKNIGFSAEQVLEFVKFCKSRKRDILALGVEEVL